jgi:uncharacterized protein (TIGR03032 family)
MAAWRHPGAVAVFAPFDGNPSRLLHHSVRGAWWETLARLGGTLLVTREYEHLIVGLSVVSGRPSVSYMPMPHPSGLSVNADAGVVYVASTRNPNIVFDLMPAGSRPTRHPVRPLVPVRARFFPGRLYTHDLAHIGGRLYATAVGLNAVVALHECGGYEPVWWPKSVERGGLPRMDRNYLQLNGIGAGDALATSFFCASTWRPSSRRPGHLNFKVDRQGVVFSGETREPMASGLTRPHSVRLHRDRIWVDNSGYGQLGFVRGGRFEPVVELPGWTRGLCFRGDVAFVATSRVLHRFRHYAPGVDPARARCGVHAVSVKSGRVLGSLFWPDGDQVFAVEWLPPELSDALPFGTRGERRSSTDLFYELEAGPRRPVATAPRRSRRSERKENVA